MSETEKTNGRAKSPKAGWRRAKRSQDARAKGETRAERRQRFAARGATASDVPYHLHGFHAVSAALGNPERVLHRLIATPNALKKLDGTLPTGLPVETVTPRDLDALVGADTVHQGLVALTDPLPERTLSAPFPRLSMVLDHVTDPHNVGAIIRSAAAFDADAVITTARHAARETATLAKAASGALELVPLLTVQNLADTLEAMRQAGVWVVGLDGEASIELPDALAAAFKHAQEPGSRAGGGRPLALVMGAEGKGLRAKTRQTCSQVARLPLTGTALASLNVSNAAVLALYIAQHAATQDR